LILLLVKIYESNITIRLTCVKVPGSGNCDDHHHSRSLPENAAKCAEMAANLCWNGAEASLLKSVEFTANKVPSGAFAVTVSGLVAELLREKGATVTITNRQSMAHDVLALSVSSNK
jgi:hypothetical protein